MKHARTLAWRSVHDALPGVYENVILCYRTDIGQHPWCVGEGYYNEDGTWTVLSELGMADVVVRAVCAWMDLPDPPRCAMQRRVHHARDFTDIKGDRRPMSAAITQAATVQEKP